MSLSTDPIVMTTVTVSPQPLAVSGFGTKFILGSATVLPLEERIRTYVKLTGGVDVDFNSTTQEYKAAQAHFSQPNARPLLIGRQFLAAQAGKLRGGTASNVIGDYTGTTNGGFDIVVNGANLQIFALNLSGAADLPAVAALIQVKLNAAAAGTTCAWNATTKQFVIGSSTTGVTSIVNFAVAPTGGSSPTDVSSLLKLRSIDGALSVNGIAIESFTAALSASRAFNKSWFGLEVTSTTAQDVKDAMAFVEANALLFFYSTPDANAKSSVATTDLGYYAKNLGYAQSAVFFDDVNSDHYLSGSAMAQMFGIDYDQPDSFETLKFKSAPGYATVNITETERIALIGDLASGVIGKNYNIYADYGVPMFTEGTVANGRFIDEIIGLAWQKAQINNALFNALYTARTKIPQTDAGAIQLTDPVRLALKKGKTSGLIAPGFWTGPNIGTVKTGDYLPDGFLVFAQPVAQQSAGDRALRKSVPITAIALLAGAVHSSAVGFNVQR